MRINKYDKSIFVVLLGFLLIQILNLGKSHYVEWDEAVFIGIGKYIWSLGKSGLWEIIRPLGLPILLGFIWKLNLDPIFWGEVLMIIFSVGTLYLTYLIGAELFGKKTGLIAVLLIILTPVFFRYSSKILTGIPSTFLALVSIYFFIKKKYMISGFFSGISLIFRYPQAIVLISYLVLLFYDYLKTQNIKSIIKLLSGFFIVFCPLLIFHSIYYGFDKILYPFIKAAWHQHHIVYSVIDGSLVSYIYNILFYAVEIIKQNILYLLLPIGIKIKRKKEILVIAGLFIVYFTFILNKQIRFALVFLPYIALLCSVAVIALIKRNKYLIIALIILLIPSILANFSIYNERSYNEPEINEFNSFLQHGSVLTTNPVPAAFSDIKLIPYYNTVDDAVSVFSVYKDKVDYIVYTTEFYPCFDEECYDKRERLFQDVINAGEVIFHKEYDQEYYIIER